MRGRRPGPLDEGSVESLRNSPVREATQARRSGIPLRLRQKPQPRLWAQGPAGAVIPLRVQREGDAFDVEIRSADRTALLRKPRFN